MYFDYHLLKQQQKQFLLNNCFVQTVFNLTEKKITNQNINRYLVFWKNLNFMSKVNTNKKLLNIKFNLN